MLRLKPFLLGATCIAASIVLLGVLHHRMPADRDALRASVRQELSVGFLPVT